MQYINHLYQMDLCNENRTSVNVAVREISDIAAFWVLLANFLSKNGNFSQFCFSDGYTLYQTLIERWPLRIKWGVNHPLTTSGSSDTDFGLFQPVLAKNTKSAISVSLRDILYMIDIYKNGVLRLKWGFIRLHTSSGSWDMRFWLFSLFKPKWLFQPVL